MVGAGDLPRGVEGDRCRDERVVRPGRPHDHQVGRGLRVGEGLALSFAGQRLAQPVVLVVSDEQQHGWSSGCGDAVGDLHRDGGGCAGGNEQARSLAGLPWVVQWPVRGLLDDDAGGEQAADSAQARTRRQGATAAAAAHVQRGVQVVPASVLAKVRAVFPSRAPA